MAEPIGRRRKKLKSPAIDRGFFVSWKMTGDESSASTALPQDLFRILFPTGRQQFHGFRPQQGLIPGMLEMANGHFFKGLGKMITG